MTEGVLRFLMKAAFAFFSNNARRQLHVVITKWNSVVHESISLPPFNQLRRATTTTFKISRFPVPPFIHMYMYIYLYKLIYKCIYLTMKNNT